MEKLDKEKLIKREISRLNKLYSNLSPSKKKAAAGLIERAAYAIITLKEYEKDLDLNGSVELFTQSLTTPPYERERPVARLYTNLLGKYISIQKALNDLLPTNEPEKEDALLKFLKEN